MSVNKQVSDYLDFYCGLEHPSYAVLLKGQWGCGKSHFISKYQSDNRDKKFVYISLYGLNSVSQIDDALFQSVNPRLGSDSLRAVGRLASSSLKSTVGIDVTSGRQYLKQHLTKTKGKILIFDDLERCKMPAQEVLGYINAFVEHDKRHVIILAEDSKVEDEEYPKVKEKLIGQEFEIQTSINEAFKSFCMNVEDLCCREHLEKNTFLLEIILQESKQTNLRTLKKIVQDFEYIFRNLPEEAQEATGLLEEILIVLAMLSLEIRSANISSEQIPSFFHSSILDQDNNSPFVHRKKYLLYNSYTPVLGVELWKEFFSSGFFTQEKLNEAVFNSSHFQDKNTPDWIKLWHAVDATDEEFESRKEIVLESLSRQVYKEEPVILHVFGLFLWMSKKGINKDSSKQVLQKFTDYVDKLVEEKSLTFLKDGDNFDSEAHFSLAYFGREEEEFQEFVNYLNQKKQEVAEESFPIQAEELMNIMESDTRLFEQMLVLSNSEVQKYFSIPILKYIKPIRFMDALDKSKDQRTVVSAFERRYEFSEYNKILLDELPWLEDVKVLLEREVIDREGKISGWRYKRLIKVIDTAIDKLRVIQAGDSVA